MLTDEEIDTIKAAWEKLYQGPGHSAVTVFPTNLEYVAADEPTIVERGK